MQLQRLFALSLAFSFVAVSQAPQVKANPYQANPPSTYLQDSDDKPAADQGGDKKDKDSDDQDSKKEQPKDDSDKDKGGDN
jgi:hypothetical protein